MNRYASVPNDIKGRVKEAATKALENEIRAAIQMLRLGEGGRFEATIRLLESLIGDKDE